MATLLDVLDAAVNHHMAGRLTEAAALYHAVLAAEPTQPDALHLLGVLAAQHGAPERAVPLIARSLKLRPSAAAPWAHLGGALRAQNRWDAAGRALARALALDPAESDALDGLGAVHHALAHYSPARAWLTRAARLRPGSVETLVNLGTVLRDLRRFAEADAVFAAALARRPDHRDAHLARAVSHLVQGHLRTGWEEFEWRWHRFATPSWTGERLDGRTLLLHGEQGFGDAIQFVRYAPLVARAVAEQGGGRVVLETHPMLFRLFRTLSPALQVVVRGPEPPPHDLQCPLMSLPRAFGTELATIPAPPAYLSADAAEVARWAERLNDGSGALRVGLVWAGNPKHRNDRNRSIPVETLGPLLAVPGVRFFSLQVGDAGAARPDGVGDLAAHLRDFADTAVILKALDLVIAVDTATVHLAGALGVPAWLLLPFAPDWRWLLDRGDSPWYPSLRLFRQPRPGDWDTALATVAAVLRSLTNRRANT